LIRNGNDLAPRFPTAVAAIAALPVRSCIIDGEAIACDESGLAVFDLVRGGHVRNARALLCALDLLQLDGDDIRRGPIQERKRRLGELLKRPQAGIALNHHFAEDGSIPTAPTISIDDLADWSIHAPESPIICLAAMAPCPQRHSARLLRRPP